LGLGGLFSFLILYTVCRNSSEGRPACQIAATYTEDNEKRVILRVEFEITTPVLEREKTVHATDRTANVIGNNNNQHLYKYLRAELSSQWAIT
jgi:hypothetical protein